MKLASYTFGGERSYGVVTEMGICDVRRGWPDGPPTLRAALEAGPTVLERIAELHEDWLELVPDDEVDLLPPIPDAPKVIGLAVNYAEHHKELSRGAGLPDDAKRRTTPRPFLMPQTALLAHGQTIPWPTFSEQIDHEVELAVIIGRTAACVTPEEARGVVAGYTVANDVSARSVTFAEGRADRPKNAFFDWLHGKWADGFCPTGPWLVTADEIPDPQDLQIACRVNGETRQDANTRHMIFDVFELISFISRLMTLVPGDLIATGTPSGVGMATGKLLAAGDEIACEIEGVGELVNTLGPRPKAFYRPCASQQD